MDTIKIGEILKAQGIKGEVKIKPITDDVSRYKKLKMVYIENKPYQITGVRFDFQFAYLAFAGIVDRNQAELLRGKMIEIDRIHAVALEEDSFFIADIVGCTLLDEQGNELAILSDVLKSGAADVFVGKTKEGKELRFPFLNRIVCKVDIEQKQFIVYKKLFDEVCVYDD